LDLPIKSFIFFGRRQCEARRPFCRAICISEASEEMNDVRNRYILLALVVGATCLLMYLIGIFYQKFLNSPYDLVALIFIVAFYAATLYFHLQRPGGES
jgi:biotin transporter BioY